MSSLCCGTWEGLAFCTLVLNLMLDPKSARTRLGTRQPQWHIPMYLRYGRVSLPPHPGMVLSQLSLSLVVVLALRVSLQVVQVSSHHKNQHFKFKFDWEFKSGRFVEGTGACRNPGEKKMGNVKECRKRDGIPREAESGRNRKNTQQCIIFFNLKNAKR